MKNYKAILAFLYSFSKLFYINLIGKLFYSEIFAIGLFPFINFNRLIRKYPRLIYIIKCLVILLLSQLISDIINESKYQDYIRGWSLIIISIILILFLVNLFDDKKVIIYYYLIGTFLSNLFI